MFFSLFTKTASSRVFIIDDDSVLIASEPHFGQRTCALGMKPPSITVNSCPQANLHTSCAEILHESQGHTVERLSRADGSICRRQIAIIALTGSCSIGGNFVCTVNIPEVCVPSIMVESCVPHQTMVVPLIIILFLYICALDSQSFLEAEVYDYFGNRSVFRIW